MLWLVGDGSVVQRNVDSEGTASTKVRPIDDLSEFSVHMTNSCERTIAPMGVDTIVVSLVLRLDGRPPSDVC